MKDQGHDKIDEEKKNRKKNKKEWGRKGGENSYSNEELKGKRVCDMLIWHRGGK